MMQQKASGRVAQRQAFSGAQVSPAVSKVSARGRAVVSAKAQAVAAPTISKEMVDKCVNTIRFVAIDAVNKSKSGHPGMPMGCAVSLCCALSRAHGPGVFTASGRARRATSPPIVNAPILAPSPHVPSFSHAAHGIRSLERGDEV